MDELRARVGRESQALQAAVDDVDRAAATALGVNRTDLRCLEVLIRGESTPGALAAELGLTSGSVTTMLDRLAKLGHVTREPEPGDRRKVLIRITPETKAEAWKIYGPIAEEGAAEMAAYTGDQLHTILDFLTRSRALQQRHRDRISALPKTIRSANA
ncbi:MarR family winged helix-turn-helix transcriptional regulator [Nocardia sp. CDC160]|uniref:MarR family winged helix-turn-helix transcriptional regulator n=1 Tax=Nocardia sp. CDC160 TaxID=3112166 RepID=UPI002DB80FE6|nr:MarR family transcriptional regulator [Nocardia sp. CDC160]MEC3914532.1 MarR family transcriptional regulator [Nocardia sp. CDC160]